MTGQTDRIFGIGFLVMGLGLFAYSLSFRETDLMGDLGPGFLPGLVGVILAILGTLQAIRPGNKQAEPIDRQRFILAVVFFLAVAVYALFFAWFGFSWPSFVFLIAVMSLLGGRSPRSLAIYALLSAVFVGLIGWVLLHVLSVPLRGVWFLN
ncbi:tripartite tricarboxylate transporter TctB family protein [Devosia ginsengisoli]|uniref:Tripartite tricarboxylate transporter TctB family protein n=1 Tax=Devosia ginsengisoli TaxID=400770 RepID=A0A5B8LYC7_9HYPH|nr:tripartite tricarboxylate transporter TctB family protein [Devosia ginsengisoli]QDZ12821.1 tripartite tricarboxylate transporter TctB family protein [Devosia ginsengisoli]